MRRTISYRIGGWRGEAIGEEFTVFLEEEKSLRDKGRVTRDSRSTLAVCLDELGLHFKVAKPKGVWWRLEYGLTGGRLRRAFRSGLLIEEKRLSGVRMLLWGVKGFVFAQKGVLLSHLVRGEKLSPDADDEVLHKVGAVLATYHNAGVLHGDFKPPNILVMNNGEVVPADYDNTRFYRHPLEGQICWVDIGRIERALGERLRAVLEGYAEMRRIGVSVVKGWR